MADLNDRYQQLRRTRIDVVRLLLILNLAMFAGSIVVSNRLHTGHTLQDSAGTFSPGAATLWLMGGNQPYSVLVDGEYYRLVTSSFLHANLLHIAVNMWALLALASFASAALGKMSRLWTLWVVGGIAGSLASLFWHAMPHIDAPDELIYLGPGVGASGALFAVLGYLIGFSYRTRSAAGGSILRQLVTVTIVNLVIGFSIPVIDNAAHIGGLLCGVLFGIIMEAAPRQTVLMRLRRVIVSPTLAIVCTVLTVLALGQGIYEERFGRGAEFREMMNVRDAYVRVIEVREFADATERGSKSSIRRARNKIGDLRSDLEKLEPADARKTIQDYLQTLDRGLKRGSQPSPSAILAFNKLGERLLRVMRRYAGIQIRLPAKR